jgi:hypothetical protein
MLKKYIMNLQLFDDGGEGGSESQGGSAGTGNGGQGSAGKGTYSFEQAEEIANARADRATKAALADFFRKQGMSEDEITAAIADYKAKKQASQPNVSAIEKERDDARSELETMKNSNLLRDKGVRPEDLDYVLFKVNQKITDKVDFKKAADEFLKENPRFTGQGTYRVTTSSQAGGSGTTQTGNDFINNAIRNAARR